MANHYVGDGLPTIRDVRVLPRANRAFLTGHSRSRAATSSTPNLWLVCASKVYSGLGADIVYGSITLIIVSAKLNWRAGLSLALADLFFQVIDDGAANGGQHFTTVRLPGIPGGIPYKKALVQRSV